MPLLKRKIGYEITSNGEVIHKSDDAIAIVEVSRTLNAATGTLALTIFGLSIDTMAKISSSGLSLTEIVSLVIRVFAKTFDKDDNLVLSSLVFEGIVRDSVADFNSAPEVNVRISSTGGDVSRQIPASATSIPGAVKVADVIQEIARKANVKAVFQDDGSIFQNPYFDGTPFNQFDSVSKAAGFNYFWEGDTITFSNPSKPVDNDIIEVNADMGMIGYPIVGLTTITFNSLYSQSFNLLKQVRIKSVVKSANGVWTINRSTDTLSTHPSGGEWFSSVTCFRTVS